ncbi:MAG: glycosyltransferase family 2 protein [Bdellovibrionales bacterium]|nr:glycosyltransferase family 2 protein [Bdellovibrionales bacterium]
MQTEFHATTAAAAEREPVSAFIICFNEEQDIEECLKSVQFCDEVVVIDSFSTDRTVEICERYHARVIQRPWPGYREQKAFGLAATTHEWVLNLDADERVSPELRENLLALLRRDWEERRAGVPTTLADGYEVNRTVWYLGRWWRRGGWYPEFRMRFFRKSKVTWGGTDPHEKPIVDGTQDRIGGEIYHFTYKSFSDQVERLHRFSSIAAEEEFKKGGRSGWRRLLLNPLLRSFKFFVLKGGFQEGKAGLVVALAEGYYTFMKYAKLWELEHKEAHLAARRREAANEG